MPPFDRARAYDSFADFINKNPNRIIRFLVYRRMFTPQEMERKYSDQSYYESSFVSTGMIREVIPLPDGDIMLGIGGICDDISDMNYLEYYRLSEIRMSYWPKDDTEYGAIPTPEVNT